MPVYACVFLLKCKLIFEIKKKKSFEAVLEIYSIYISEREGEKKGVRAAYITDWVTLIKNSIQPHSSAQTRLNPGSGASSLSQFAFYVFNRAGRGVNAWGWGGWGYFTFPTAS